MGNDNKRIFREELTELYMQRTFYIMEHKESSMEIEGKIKELKKQYSFNCLKEDRRDNNDKH